MAAKFLLGHKFEVTGLYAKGQLPTAPCKTTMQWVYLGGLLTSKIYLRDGVERNNQEAISV